MNGIPHSSLQAQDWLERIRALPVKDRFRVMNVCGGHERSISMAGLRNALPPNIELIPGPGCPICVCPEEDIYAAIQLTKRRDVLVVTFGDMLRVPVNVPSRQVRSLEEARAAGGDVRPIASPREAIRIARENPGKQVVFFAAGFETTMAPVAGMLMERPPQNLSILLSGRLTWPAVAMLLDSEEAGFDALIAPGHVATVMGPEEWSFVATDHAIPAAVAGFDAGSILRALYSVLRQRLEGRVFLDNCYGAAVRSGGNPTARRLLGEAFAVVDANWRGIGAIPRSGFALDRAFAGFDAIQRFGLASDEARKGAGKMPQGCDCARVVLGKIRPDQCVLYGRTCTPRSPVGPCMVSDEGACRIWWSAGVRRSRHQVDEPA